MVMGQRILKFISILVVFSLLWQQVAWPQGDLLRVSPSAMLRARAWGERAGGKAKEITALCKLATSQQSYGNLDNLELYKLAAELLGITTGLALDVATGGNPLPAQGLIQAGLEKVIMLNDYKEKGWVGGKLVSEKGDATALPFGDNMFDAVVHNQNLSFIGYGSKAYSDFVASGEKQGELLSDYVVTYAVKESYRVLKPGGWILLKPGAYDRDTNRRYDEGSKIVASLRNMGFVNITTLTAEGTDIPVFIYARKPILAIPIPLTPQPPAAATAALVSI